MASTKCEIDENMRQCNCTYEPCSRKGKCCECLTYHRRHGELPACLFPDDVEATYDRSVATFVRTYGERGRCF